MARETSTRLSSTRRRLAAQALAATEARLASTPVQLDVPTQEVTPMANTAAAPTLESLVAALQSALSGAVAPAATVVAPAAKPGQAKWDKHAEDLVVVRVLANGVPVNQHGMFLSRAKAIDPKGLLSAKPAAAAKPAAPVAIDAPAEQRVLALLAELLGAKAAVQIAQSAGVAPVAAVAAKPTGGLDALVVSDGTWMRCRKCESAYWGTFRGTEYVLAKATKHYAKAHSA